MEKPMTNRVLEKAIHRFYAEQSRETLIGVLEAIRIGMYGDGEWMIAVTPPQLAFDMLNPEKIKVGDTITFEDELHFRVNHLQTDDGREWMAAFTSDEEIGKGEGTSMICQHVEDILKGSRDMREAGIMINPWDENFLLTKELIRMILEADLSSGRPGGQRPLN